MTTDLSHKKVAMFDFNYTLVHPARPMNHIAVLAALADVPLGQFKPVFNSFEEAYETGLRPVERMEGILDQLGVYYTNSLIAELIQLEEMTCLEAMEPYPRVYWMLRRLAAADYQLVLVCNGNPNTIGIYEDMGFADQFDAAVFSCQHSVGVCKPHPKIFQVAMERIGSWVDPADCVYIGDGGDRELTGIKAAYPEVTTIRVAHPVGRHKRQPDAPGIASDYVVEAVADVAQLLVLSASSV